MTEAWQNASRDNRADWHSIDCSESRVLAERMDVSSFPTILRYHKGSLEEYEGDRSVKTIMEFGTEP